MEMSASCPDPYDLGERNCDDTTVVCEWKKVRTRLWVVRGDGSAMVFEV